jgi:hypothetical protein
MVATPIFDALSCNSKQVKELGYEQKTKIVYYVLRLAGSQFCERMHQALASTSLQLH